MTSPDANSAPGIRSTRRDTLVVAAIGVAYFLALRLAFLYPDAQRVVSAVWPAAGVGLASLLLAPRRLWPAIAPTIFVVGSVANVTVGVPLLAGLGYMTANVAESVASAWVIITLCGSRVRFATVRAVLVLIACATLVNAATACVGAATGALISGSRFTVVWQTWFVANGLGILLVTPFVVAWVGRPRLRDVRWTSVAEFVVFGALWSTTAWLTFRASNAADPGLWRPYLLFAFLPWPAHRLGQRGTALALLLMAVIMIATVAVDAGPSILGGASASERLLMVQVFLAVLGGAGLLLAASFAETRDAGRAAREAHDRLRVLGDNIPEGMVYQLVGAPDGTMHFTYVSAGVERVLGITADEMLQNPAAFFARIHEEDRERFRAARETAAGMVQPTHDRFRFRRADGEERWIQISSAPRQLDDGRVQWDGAAMDATERTLADERLRESEARFQTIAAQLDDFLFISDDTTTFTYVSPAAERVFGYAPAEMEGRSFLEYVVEEDRGSAIERFRQSVAEGTSKDLLTFRMRRRDGTEFAGEIRAAVYREGGRLIAIGSIRDVTERRRTEEALRESEARFRSMFENNHAAMLLIDPEDGAIVDANPAATAFYGWSREALASLTVSDINTLSPELVAAELQAAQANRRNYFQFRHRRADGSLRDVEVYSSPVTVGGRRLLYSIIHDTTERALAEEALRVSEEKYRVLVEMESDAVVLVDNASGRILEANAAVTSLYGFSHDELLARTNASLSAEPEQTQRATSATFLPPDELIRIPLRWHRKRDGTVFPVDITARHFIWNGRPVHIAAIRDITDRKRAETALAESHRVLEDVQEMAHLGSWAIDLDTRTMVASPAAHRIYGIADDAIALATIQGVALPEYRPALDAALAALLAGEAPYDTEFKIRRPTDGDIRTIHSVATYDAAHRRVTGFIQDVTERKRAEEQNAALQAQVYQSQKIESVGRLAGGVAHDFNNALQTILLNTEMALAHTAEGSALRRHLADIMTSAQHSAALTSQLLAFARKQPARPRVVDLNAVITTLLPLLQRLIGEDVTTVWTPGHGLWHVRADPTQVHQILNNLAVNARDAIAGVGRLALATANVTVDADLAAAHPGLAPGDFVRLTVTDDGCGMDAETLAHVFEPFFTTKPVGAGTGLGLATVHGIVSQNGGAVSVDSAPGRGATFAIWLPRVEAPDAPLPAPGDAAAPRGGAETILLVEDEASLLRACSAILSGLGYTVLAAERPGVALRLAAAHEGPIHLLVTDVVMPEMNGHVLAERLTATRPALQRLYISGYSGDTSGPPGVIDAGAPFLAKPFAADELGRKVRDVLDRKAGP